MSVNQYQTNGKLPSPNQQLSPMQWFLLVVTTLWVFAALIGTFLLFWHTQNILSFTFFTTVAPPLYVWYRMTGYLYPKDDRDYEVALERIRHGYGIPFFKPSNKSLSKTDNF
jgi:hypothetical protein